MKLFLTAIGAGIMAGGYAMWVDTDAPTAAAAGWAVVMALGVGVGLGVAYARAARARRDWVASRASMRVMRRSTWALGWVAVRWAAVSVLVVAAAVTAATR